MNLRYLNVSQLAQVSGLDRRTVSERLEGHPIHSNEGKAIIYDTPKALPVLLIPKSVSLIEKRLKAVQLQVEEERLEKLKLENAKIRSELISFDEVLNLFGRQCSTIRAKMLAQPSALAKILSMDSDPATVKKTLEDWVTDALTELTVDSPDELFKGIQDQGETPPDVESSAETQPS